MAWLETLVLAGRAQEARQILATERTRFPGDPAVQSLAARLHGHLGDWEEAIRELTTALLDDPQSETHRRFLARAYMAAGRHAAALPIWRELAASAEQPPQRVDYLRQWALCLLATGDYAEAVRFYKLQTLTNPDDAAAQVGLASALLADGRAAEAVAAARRALELEPGRIEARVALACAYAQLGETARATALLAEDAAHADDDPLVRELLARWRAAADPQPG